MRNKLDYDELENYKGSEIELSRILIKPNHKRDINGYFLKQNFREKDELFFEKNNIYTKE